MSEIDKIKHFPKGFYWGAATSSHQIEGGQKNDWSEWEIRNADRLAREAEKKFGHIAGWRERFGKEASKPENYISGLACDSWNRFEEDYDILEKLNLNAYRFSIEWSRIEPDEGVFDEQAIAHYRLMLDSLHKRGITPFVTLWHWTLPLWLSRKGGLAARKFPIYFNLYTKKVVNALGKNVEFWVTLNEFEVCSTYGYLIGWWPPQKKNIFTYVIAIRNLLLAHKLAYKTIKNDDTNAKVGIAKHQVPFEIERTTAWNKILQFFANYFWNTWFLQRFAKYQDFIGLNNYHRNMINNWFNKNPNIILTDFGWEYWPSSIYNALINLKKYNKPIYITENGLADSTDKLREKFVPASLSAVHKAISEGVDVRGYLYWSLIDNFEWDKGFWPRFGLVEIDFKTQKRTIRQSAYVYKNIAARNALN